MDKTKYAALLRGINVGGKNIIKMDALRGIFEEMKFSDVKTYIQTGNVIFKDIEKNKTKLTKKIEKKLFEKTGAEINVVLLTVSEMEKIINKKPEKFGEEPEIYKYDVLYLIEPLTPKDAVNEFNPKETIDNVYKGEKVIYISILKKEITKSRIFRIIGTDIYKKITIRNWNTTEKLNELMQNE